MANFQRQGNPMPAGGPWQHAQFSEVPAPPALQAQLPTLDWRGYFTRFQAVHGEPINHKGRLLYRDGGGTMHCTMKDQNLHHPRTPTSAAN